MCELFYNFKLDGAQRGYSYLHIDNTSLYSHTEFLVEGGETYSNVFRLRLDGERILACKHGERDWLDFSNQPINHYPGCAYPLLLPKVKSQPYKYTQISEDSGRVLGGYELHPIGQEIVELCDGQVSRRFTMNGNVPIQIDWGGAISELCETADESVAGSGIVFMGRRCNSE
ncbi:MAG: hypothetical protein KTR18_08305 [Acidiferrobacterales bacterium]|nr:hypothetical protein [Acidiferrobacterales bacterium]